MFIINDKLPANTINTVNKATQSSVDRSSIKPAPPSPFENFVAGIKKAFAPPETPKSLMDFFELQVKQQPQAVACGENGAPDKALTYEQLNAKANQLAHYLMKEGVVKSGDRVVISGQNQVETLISMLAILKLGAAFVIVESKTPQEKLKQIVAQSEASCVLLAHPADGVAVGLDPSKILNLQIAQKEITTLPDTPPPVEKIEESQLAYILFTSGSTSSTPKAVMQTRQGLLGQMQNYAKDLGLSSKDRLLQISHIAHDQALCNIFGSLISGASLVFHDLSEFNLQEVREAIVANNATVYTSISSVFHLIFSDVQDQDYFPPSLRLIRLGGEAVTREHLELFCRIATKRCSFGIGYGATECSWIAYNSFTKQEASQALEKGEIPLGKFSSHTTARIVQDEESSTHNGELRISSPYLALGMADAKGEYATGDIFEVKNGHYFFKGRQAWHVKINGQRVSLKEVEDVLKSRFPEIEECVVITDPEEKHLYAFYTLKSGMQITQNANEIRQALNSMLQSHEIPLDYFQLEEFPRLENKKLDRIQLKAQLEKKIEAAKKASEIAHLILSIRSALS